MSKVPKGSGMITSLVGPNSYARKVALEKMVAEFSSKHGSMAIERLDGEETTVAQTKEALESISFLTPQKLVVWRTQNNQLLWRQKRYAFERLFYLCYSCFFSV